VIAVVSCVAVDGVAAVAVGEVVVGFSPCVSFCIAGITVVYYVIVVVVVVVMVLYMMMLL